ncbi:hypothetical protein [Seleniivibrio woodruffii]|uniref:Uncharacterized protein n=1 Tax=Seleniivibrio woodruffii TaxID=1078050 RepID=A0A4R1KCY6_9BACT|nr:hypothetical protein [Seleniivibrio woodruffii]TCK61910.1 hypothetical protein C8D98_0417 [Seleniivibrio woodruffii]TVZ34973.1 hypothetical protein OF66_0575 [Seleniivibrio woodruffii]
MNKKLFPIFVVFVLVLIGISTWPYVVESRMPVNQFISKEKKSGMVPIVQFVTDDMQVKIAETAAAQFNEKAPTKVIVGAFKIGENQKSAEQYGMKVPGYVIFDADGKVAVQEFGVISQEKLTEIISGVHTH